MKKSDVEKLKFIIEGIDLSIKVLFSPHDYNEYNGLHKKCVSMLENISEDLKDLIVD